MAVSGFVKYFKDLASNPKKVLPSQGMTEDEWIEFNRKVSIRYHLDYNKWYLHGYMQLWYKYFGLMYPFHIMR